MSIHEQYTSQLASISSKRDSIESLTSTLIGLVPSSDIDDLPPRETAELSFTTAHVIVNLFLGYLLCQGIDTNKHSVRHEVDRLQSYMQKMSPASESLATKRKRGSSVVGRLVRSNLGVEHQ